MSIDAVHPRVSGEHTLPWLSKVEADRFIPA